ncbi:MAG: cbb3-type cytochrome c oxidase subunit 3 [Alphaproteobacteria bacterium]|nr:cbb3-type cytochrome c oxidase subunit 3 [Alphaproteobacteria bacterium]
MMEFIATYAPTAALLFFFVFFAGIVFWVFRPGAKKTLQSHAQIPLKEDRHGGE